MPPSEIQTNHSIRIIVLFSLGIPLEQWQKTGLAAREKVFYQRFVDKRHQVSLLTYGKNDLQYQAYWQDIKILPWIGKMTHFVKYACLAPFYHRAAFKQAEIVKSNQSQGALVGVIAKLVNPKLKFVLRCGWVRTKEVIKNEEKRTGARYYRAVFFEWLAVKLSNAIIVVTQSDADYLISHYSAKAKKIHIIPNSIDTNQYLYTPSTFQDSLLKKSTIKLLLVGRLVEAKNFHKVIAAVAKIDACIDVSIVGVGEYQKALIDKASQCAVNVNFLGSVPNDQLASIYGAHDVVVMPEAWGSGMPKVVLEAMASGTMIIASNIRSVRQVVVDGVNGLICEPTEQSIHDKIMKVIQISSEERLAMLANAKQDIDQKYSMDAAVKSELRLFHSLLQNH